MLRAIMRRLGLERWIFTLAYLRHRVPWDTGVAPPELVRMVEGTGPERLPPGRALDLGCGTGTNSVYLARHGWQVTGIDFAAPAIALAHTKAQAAQSGKVPGEARFLRGDVTHLEALDVRGPYDLIFDLGCFHGINPWGWPRYAAGVTRIAAPGALLLLYAFEPTLLRGRTVGLTAEMLGALFAPAWTVEHVERGVSPSGHASAWYWLRHAT